MIHKHFTLSAQLICKNCCKKAPLEYKQGKIERVCLICFEVIVNKRKSEASDSSGGDLSPKKKGVLQVCYLI